MSTAGRLRASAQVSAVRDALGEDAAGRAWVVGGAVRDAALERPVTDLDLAVAGDPARPRRR